MPILTRPAPAGHAPWCDQAEHDTRTAAAHATYGDHADPEACGSPLITTSIGDTTLTALLLADTGQDTTTHVEASRGAGPARQVLTLALTPTDIDHLAAWLTSLARTARDRP